MKITSTKLPGVMVVETARISDHRGAFARYYCEHELAAAIEYRRIVQINHSRTTQTGTVRGMHYQYPPYAEMKLVRCLKGRVWDVAVDLRANSPTFLKWHAVELSEDNARMIIIPEGCAHGFQVMAQESELLYLHTAFYNPDAESGVSPKDPLLAIDWPHPVTGLSTRDSSHPLIQADFTGITL